MLQLLEGDDTSWNLTVNATVSGPVFKLQSTSGSIQPIQVWLDLAHVLVQLWRNDNELRLFGAQSLSHEAANLLFFPDLQNYEQRLVTGLELGPFVRFAQMAHWAGELYRRLFALRQNIDGFDLPLMVNPDVDTTKVRLRLAGSSEIRLFDTRMTEFGAELHELERMSLDDFKGFFAELENLASHGFEPDFCFRGQGCLSAKVDHLTETIHQELAEALQRHLSTKNIMLFD
jgi:hypothetical protein